ncbi:MAG: Cystathionine gamma-synthase, partial [Leptospirillum sp. Group IV 'UBA BS']
MAEETTGEGRGFDTIAVHGEEGGDPFRALTPPIYMTSTYTFPSMETVDRVLSGEEEGFVYSRSGNPTVRQFERTMARLEGGEEGVAFASGMGAISAVLLSWQKKGTPFLFSRHLYSGTRHFIESMLIPLGATVRFVDFRQGPEAFSRLAEALDEGACGLFLETPSNPTLDLVDLEATAALCRRYGVPLAVDNTFASPALQNPLLLGADLVIHSATKYLGGHGDLLGGVAVGG